MKRFGAWIVVVACVGLGTGIVVFERVSRAQTTDPPETRAPDGDGRVLPKRTRSPFAPYPTSDGAIAYDTMSDSPIPNRPEEGFEDGMTAAEYELYNNETKQAVDDTQTWAETKNGYAVSQRYRSLSSLRRAQAKIKAAEYEAGTTGLGDVGVE